MTATKPLVSTTVTQPRAGASIADRERQLGMSAAERPPPTLGLNQVSTREGYDSYVAQRRPLMAAYNAALYGNGTKAGVLAAADKLRALDARFRSLSRTPMWSCEVAPSFKYETYLKERKPLAEAVQKAQTIHDRSLKTGETVSSGLTEAKAKLNALDERFHGGKFSAVDEKHPWSAKPAPEAPAPSKPAATGVSVRKRQPGDWVQLWIKPRY